MTTQRKKTLSYGMMVYLHKHVEIVLFLASLYQTSTVSVYLHTTQTIYINKLINAVTILNDEIKMAPNNEGSLFYPILIFVCNCKNVK